MVILIFFLFQIIFRKPELPVFLESIVDNKIVTTTAQIAEIKFFIISDVRSTLNASDTAIVFGFGDMIFPAFPPPIIARSSASL